MVPQAVSPLGGGRITANQSSSPLIMSCERAFQGWPPRVTATAHAATPNRVSVILYDTNMSQPLGHTWGRTNGPPFRERVGVGLETGTGTQVACEKVAGRWPAAAGSPLAAQCWGPIGRRGVRGGARPPAVHKVQQGILVPPRTQG